MTSMDPKHKAILYMLICALLWSTGGILIKILLWNPMAIAGMRSLIAAGVYIIFMRRNKISFVINKYSILSSILLCGSFVFFVVANKLTAAANAVVLLYSAPIFIILFSSVIYKQKFRKADFLTVLFTFGGIALFFFDELSGGYMAGNLLALLSGAFYGAMFVATGRADDRSRSCGIFLGHVFTAIIGIPFVFLLPTPITPATVAAILALGIFQLGIPYILYGMAARHCSALTCSLIGAIEPLLNPVWVFLFYGEVPRLFALLGGIVVITAVLAWTVWSSKNPADEPADLTS